MEGISDALLGDFDGLPILGADGAIFQGRAEEVDDSEREPLLRIVGCLSMLATLRRAGG